MAEIAFGFKEKTGATNQWPTQEKFDLIKGEVGAVRVFEGPWEKRINFILQIINPDLEIEGAQIFRLPDQYPFFRTAFATTVEVIGKGTSSQDSESFPVWTRAEITVKYEAKSYNAGEGGSLGTEGYTNRIFIEESCDSSYELVQVPGWETFHESASGRKIRNAKGGPYNFILNYNVINLKFINILRPNWVAIERLIGTVNNLPFITPAGRIFGAETSRYEGPSGFTKVNIFTGGGQPVEIEGIDDFPLPLWEITHTFISNRFGWNNRFIKGVFEKIIKEDGENFFHETANHFDLFFPPGAAGFSGDILRELAILISDLNTLLTNNSNDFNNPAVIAKQNEILNKQRELGFRV